MKRRGMKMKMRKSFGRSKIFWRGGVEFVGGDSKRVRIKRGKKGEI